MSGYNLELRLEIEDIYYLNMKPSRELTKEIRLPFIPSKGMGLHLCDGTRVYITHIDYRVPTDDFVVRCLERSHDVEGTAKKYIGKGWKPVRGPLNPA